MFAVINILAIISIPFLLFGLFCVIARLYHGPAPKRGGHGLPQNDAGGYVDFNSWISQNTPNGHTVIDISPQPYTVVADPYRESHNSLYGPGPGPDFGPGPRL